MTPEESRAAFEKWYYEQYNWRLRRYDGDGPMEGTYARPEARTAWAAWQAAIEWQAGLPESEWRGFPYLGGAE